VEAAECAAQAPGIPGQADNDGTEAKLRKSLSDRRAKLAEVTPPPPSHPKMYSHEHVAKPARLACHRGSKLGETGTYLISARLILQSCCVFKQNAKETKDLHKAKGLLGV